MKLSAIFCLLFYCLTFRHEAVHAQISKSAFSIKLNAGYSLSSINNNTTINLKNKFEQIISPQFCYNYLTKKYNIIECGVGLFNMGNTISYYDNAGKIVNSVYNSNQVIGIPLTFYKNLDKENHALYFGLGTIVAYNFTSSVFQNTSPDYIETTSHIKGLKINLSASMRFFFKAKNRNFSLELTGSRGLMKYYETIITPNFSNETCNIINRGSTLQLGITYFFLKKEIEE